MEFENNTAKYSTHTAMYRYGVCNSKFEYKYARTAMAELAWTGRIRLPMRLSARNPASQTMAQLSATLKDVQDPSLRTTIEGQIQMLSAKLTAAISSQFAAPAPPVVVSASQPQAGGAAGAGPAFSQPWAAARNSGNVDDDDSPDDLFDDDDDEEDDESM
jgi:hypothetical protein